MAQLQTVLNKLLDKAGKDPRLTPRLLREKAEKTMALQAGQLKAQRDQIKDLIWEWHLEAQRKENEAQVTAMRVLAKLAKVSGNAPAVFKGLKELDSDQERVIELRKRLRAKGLEFTDIPTQAEIESIRVKYEAQKDLEGLDTSLVLDSSRKRAHAEDGSGGGEEEDKVPVKSKYSRHTYASDEEAEF